jgi:hypothetical protein
MERTDTHNTKAPLSAEALGDFLHQLRRLVLDETATVRQQIFLVWSKSVPARVADGLAIEGVRVVRVESNGTIELACDRNASRFREGDVLLLNPRNPFGVPNLLVTHVVNEIRALLACRTPLEHILVVHAEWQGVDRMLERLRREFGAAAVGNPKVLAPGKHIRVCILNAATGLESPIVFVMGTHRMCEAEQSVRLSADERAELIRDNTRKFYMAFTRAGQRLAITYVGDLPDVFQRLRTSPTPPSYS